MRRLPRRAARSSGVRLRATHPPRPAPPTRDTERGISSDRRHRTLNVYPLRDETLASSTYAVLRNRRDALYNSTDD